MPAVHTHVCEVIISICKYIKYWPQHMRLHHEITQKKKIGIFQFKNIKVYDIIRPLISYPQVWRDYHYPTPYSPVTKFFSARRSSKHTAPLSDMVSSLGYKDIWDWTFWLRDVSHYFLLSGAFVKTTFKWCIYFLQLLLLRALYQCWITYYINIKNYWVKVNYRWRH